MTEYKNTKINLSLDAALRKEMSTRVNDMQTDGQIAKEIFNAFFTICRESLRRLELTEDEATCLVDCFNGTIIEFNYAHLIWANVEDAFKLEGLDQKYNLDHSFIEKLKSLDVGTCVAILDAVKRFWLLNLNSADKSRTEQLIDVGLLKK